ncbi:DUF3376 domain-containing protein [uncultured Amnibacterium sp.]|uniref:DUF3376 domain-containing protein n=1 Tax=uncultured Amnibacterium sp. TaxID=1631851 RepID=UPI0035CCA2F2
MKVLDAAASAGPGASAVADAILTAWTVEAPDDRSDEDWAPIDQVVLQLRSMTENVAELPNFDDSPWSTGLPQHVGFTGRDLAPLYAAHGMPESIDRLTFRHISSAEGPPLLPGGALDRSRRRFAVNRMLRLSGPEISTLDEAWAASTGKEAAKLAGSEVADFGAFFSRTWRRNDWWWGRLDTSDGLLHLLEDYPPFASAVPASPEAIPASTETWPDRIALAQHLVRQQMNESDNRPYSPPVLPEEAAVDGPSLDERIQRRMTHGADTIGNLPSGYRVSVASRLVRVLSRAVARTSWPARIMVHLLRPLLVLVPAVVDPPRAVLVAGLLTACGLVIEGDPHPNAVDFAFGPVRYPLPLAFPLGVLGVVLALGFVLSAVGRSAAWRAIDRRRDADGVDLAAGLTGVRTRTRRARVARLVLGMVACVLALLRLNTSGADLLFLVLLGAVLVVGAAARSAKGRLLAEQVRFGPARWTTAAGLAAVLVIVVVNSGELPRRSGFLTSVDPLALSLALAIAGFLVAITLTHGWTWDITQPSAGRAMAPVWIVLSAASGALAGTVFFGVFHLAEAASFTEVWCVVLSLLVAEFAWGTGIWWLGEWPAVTRYMASDEPRA